MRNVDPDWLRALVRRALEEELSRKGKASPAPAAAPSSVAHPSHLDVMTDLDGVSDHSPRHACLIEPHRLCSDSGYCRKLGF